MRLNPFSHGAGRRRAAMVRGDAPDDGEPTIELTEPEEAPSPAENAAASPTDERKQFGFAYRRGESWQEEPEAGIPATLPDREEGSHVLAAPEEASGWPESDPPADAPQVDALQARRAPPVSEPVVSTPHIERLREQIGADAADAIEPWLVDGDDAWARPVGAGAGVERTARPEHPIEHDGFPLEEPDPAPEPDPALSGPP